MTTTRLLVAATLAAASLPAQSITSPIGMDNTEGNASHTVLFGAIDRRFQQIDGTLVGSGPRSLSSVSFRRDGNRAAASATARTFDLTIVMGHANTTMIRPSFDDNYLTTPTTVFATRQVNMPDWTASISGPAPFDFTTLFDAPFAYNGSDALAIELTVTGSSVPGRTYVDRQNATSPFALAVGTMNETGCTATGQTEPFEINMASFNWGPNHPTLGQRLVFSGSGAPPDAAVVVHITLDTASLPVPGLCAGYMQHYIAGFQLGLSGPTGFVPEFHVDVPYNPILEGFRIASQGLSPDLGFPFLPIVVSDVKALTMPTAVSGLDCHYLYAPPGTASGTVFPNRGIIMLFQ